MIKYCVRWGPGIDRVEVERETECTVWVKGRRHKKSSSWAVYYDSWNEAHKALLHKAQRNLDAARRNLESAQGFYGNVKGLKE